MKLIQSLAFFLLLCLRATASEILDQNWPEPLIQSNGSYGYNADYGIVAQVFTPSISGTLTRLEVYIEKQQPQLFPNDKFVVGIWSTASGKPFQSLATVEFPHDPLPERNHPNWVSADFRSKNIQVTANVPLAIVLSSVGESYYSWYSTTTGAGYPAMPEYTRGTMTDRLNILNTWRVADVAVDQFFREYVDTVPEPSALYLELVAFAAIPIRRRRT